MLWGRAVHHRVDGKTVRYLPPPRSRRPNGACLPVSRIIFPKYDQTASTALAPLSRGVALRRLLKECLTLPVNLSRRRVGELALGEPQDRELVEMLPAVLCTHEASFFLSVRRALNSNTPVKLLEMPSTSPISA